MSLQQLAIGKPIEVRVENLERQVDHHTSIMDSEQGTRARAHAHLHERLDEQSKRLARMEFLIWIICAFAAVKLFT